MNLLAAATQFAPLNPLSQILAVIVGLIVMAGAAVVYMKTRTDNDDDDWFFARGYYLFIFALAGLALCAYGIGGPALFEALNK